MQSRVAESVLDIGIGQAPEPPPTLASVYLSLWLYRWKKGLEARAPKYSLLVVLKENILLGGRGELLLSIFSHSCIDSFFSLQHFLLSHTFMFGDK